MTARAAEITTATNALNALTTALTGIATDIAAQQAIVDNAGKTKAEKDAAAAEIDIEFHKDYQDC